MKILSTLFSLAISVTLASGYAWADTPSPGDFDGLWTGSGRLNDDAGPNYSCTGGGDIPIAFLVQDGMAISLFQQDGFNFRVKVKANGRIKFQYDRAGESSAGQGRNFVPIIFTGKLKGSSGKGSVRLDFCSGRWKVTKKE